jgi:two-component system, NarL family, sensor histidine kinase DegS
LAIHFRILKRASVFFSNPHLWVVLVMFVIGIIFHYPQQILGIASPSLLSPLGLTRHAVERILFLIPISYAGMFLGLRSGLASLLITLGIILPRVFLVSEYKFDALMEIGVVFFLGILVNLWFEAKRRENKLYRQLMTRLEESEQGMSISEQKYRYLFENASDAIWVQDVNGLFVDGNRAFERMTGFKREELKGVQLARFLSNESLNLAREVRNNLISGEEFEQPYEQQFSIKDGTVKTVKMSTNAVMAGGRISGFEHVARDVTLEKQQQENVRAYIQQITRAQEEERKRIARDLHDDVSPDLIVLIQKLDNLTSSPRLKLSDLKENLDGLRGQAVRALEALRATAQGLRPRIIDDLGLVAALDWIAEELEKDQNIQVQVEATGIDRELSPETQIVLFRIAQEALNNIRKHARASRVTIKVKGEAGHITMTVTDNGQGFKVPERFEDMVSAGRLGLMGMYERSRLLNGSLQIKSTPGKGTELTVQLPWQVDAAKDRLPG